MMAIKAKRVLVTAGPVWVPIDSVRVMTNIFTGRLGFLIAKEAARKGFGVVLLLGPGRIEMPKRVSKNLEIVRFHYFEELFGEMEKRIESREYGALIHTAAVPDYVPVKKFEGKIKSGKKDFSISFKPTVKIVDQVKKWDQDIFLVKFKVEAGLTKDKLIIKARESMRQSNADMIVANDTTEMVNGGHIAYIIDRKNNIVIGNGKPDIAAKLVGIIKQFLF